MRAPRYFGSHGAALALVRHFVGRALRRAAYALEDRGCAMVAAAEEMLRRDELRRTTYQTRMTTDG